MDYKIKASRTESLQGNISWRAFLDDPYYGHYKLKKLDTSQAAFYKPHLFSIPSVGIEEFQASEKNRIPLLVGSQFGTTPRPKDVFTDSKERLVATLGFSILSGCLSGISIDQYKGPELVTQLHSIPFPKSINMNEILDIPFPEVLHVEFGFNKRPPLYSHRAEIARTAVQHFQNMSYRDDFVPRKANLNRARSMLLVNEFKDICSMHLMSRDRLFDLGYFTFDAQQYITGYGIIPAAETIGIGQSIKSFPDAFLLLTPIDYYAAFKKRYHGPVDWDGIRLSWRPVTFEDGNTINLSSKIILSPHTWPQ